MSNQSNWSIMLVVQVQPLASRQQHPQPVGHWEYLSNQSNMCWTWPPCPHTRQKLEPPEVISTRQVNTYTVEPPRKGQPPNQGHTFRPLSHNSRSFFDPQEDDNIYKTVDSKVSFIRRFHCRCRFISMIFCLFVVCLLFVLTFHRQVTD